MTLKVGDQVRWKSHGGEARGKIVRVVHTDGEVSGFHDRASQDGPHSTVKLDGCRQRSMLRRPLKVKLKG